MFYLKGGSTKKLAYKIFMHFKNFLKFMMIAKNCPSIEILFLVLRQTALVALKKHGPNDFIQNTCFLMWGPCLL